MTKLERDVTRFVEQIGGRDLVVTLHADTKEIEIREKGRRNGSGYKVTIAALHSMLALRFAGLEISQRRRRRVRRGKLA